jgi:sugar-specific transcriptional regulator TrmB
MEHLRRILRQLNLTGNAVDFYIGSFRIGRTSIGKLARALGMDRSSAYLAYEQLESRGLILADTLKGVKEVWAVSPDVVSRIAQKQIDQLKSELSEVDRHLPELLGEYGAIEERPVLQSFYGRDSLYRITEDILASNAKDIRVITNQNAERKVFSAKAHDDFIQTRVKRGIRAKVLAADTPQARLLKRYDTEELRTTKIVADLKPFQHELYIYGDKVAVLGFDKAIFGFIVKASEFADLQRYMFDSIWGK